LDSTLKIDPDLSNKQPMEDSNPKAHQSETRAETRADTRVKINTSIADNVTKYIT